MSLALFLFMPYLCLAAAAFSTLWLYPRYRLSKYRYELWSIRDELIGDFRAGRIESVEAVAEGLDCLERLIANADEMTLKSGLSAYRAYRDEARILSPEDLDDETVLEVAGIAAAAEPRVRAFVLRARDAGVRKVCTGSLPAFGFAALTLLARPYFRRRKPAHRPGGNTIVSELLEIESSRRTGVPDHPVAAAY